MAFYCKRGKGECDGCGTCGGGRSYECPVCGEELGCDERVYEMAGMVVGCEHCVTVKYAESFLE